MNKLLFFVSFLILTPINVIAQKWELKSYLDDFGDPSSKKFIIQTTEGSYGYNPLKIKVVISKNLGSSGNFYLSAYWENGNAVRIGEICGGSIRFGEVFKFVIRYKTEKKESFFDVSNSIRYGTDLPSIERVSLEAVSFEIDYSELDAILLSTSLPIKCILAKRGENSFVSIFHFTLYPSNYKQLVH